MKCLDHNRYTIRMEINGREYQICPDCDAEPKNHDAQTEIRKPKPLEIPPLRLKEVF